MSGARAPKRDFGLAIERLRAVAGGAGDALLSAEPVHPDHRLLTLCAELAELRHAEREAFDEKCEKWTWPPGMDRMDPAEVVASPGNAELHLKAEAADRAYRRALRAVGKISATTPAGIYAKAVAILTSKTGAAALAMSLAEDLTRNPVLRASLWPAGEEEA